MTLTSEQIDALLAPLHPGRVKKHRGNEHLEAWDDRRHLLRVFGWGGFDIETLELACILERSVWGTDATKPFDGRHMVIYRAQVRLVIKDPAGDEVAHYDDGATGDAVNQPVLGDAHDLAMKAALSQALKRCCVNLGDRFGLSLYNDGSVKAVVGASLAHKHEVQTEASENVDGGELGEQDNADARRARAEQVAAESGLAERAEQMREKVAASAPEDHKAKAAQA